MSDQFVSNTLLSNVMSLAPKTDEISVFISENNLDLLFLTETWLNNTVEDTHVLLPNCNLMRRDRSIGHHGGVCFYSNEFIKVHRLHEFEDPNLEVLWTSIRPPRFPRGIPCIVNATVYHPPNAADNIMLDYLCRSLVTAEGHYTGCGIIIAGGFNHLNVKHLCYEFNLK